MDTRSASEIKANSFFVHAQARKRLEHLVQVAGDIIALERVKQARLEFSQVALVSLR